MEDPISQERQYEFICRQLEREDISYYTRLNNCVAVNIALGAAAATQFADGPITLRRYFLISICCLVGFLITRGIHHSNRVGGVHVAGLRRKFDDLDAQYPGIFPKPYYITPAASGNVSIGRLTGIPFVFQALWISALVIASLIYFGFARM
jgi:hypothetical protein